MCCIVLMVALVASPVMAQQAETATAGQVVPPPAATETKATVGTDLPLELPAKETSGSVDSGSTTSGKKQNPNGGTPARTKATITGVIIIATVVTAIILALRGGSKATVISAGTPRVGTPANP